MPPAPKQVVASEVSIHLQVIAVLTVADSPLYLKASPQLPPKPSQTDARIRRAEERFAAGKKAYQDGDIVTQEIEFDQAIDILLTTPETAAGPVQDREEARRVGRRHPQIRCERSGRR